MAEWTPTTEGQCNFGRPLRRWKGKTNRFCRWKTDAWVGSQKNAEFPPALSAQEKFLTEIMRTPIFFSFPFLSNIRGVVLGALHVSDSMPKGAEDPGIQTDQNCYVLLGSSGFIYKSLKTIIRPLVPSRKHSQENARMIKRNIWRYLNQIFLQEVLIKRWERAIYQLGLLF